MTRNKNLFILNFGRRDVNLGDKFIFLSLLNALEGFGAVRFQGTPPSFTRNLHSIGNKWQSLAYRASLIARGWSIYNVSPPGGGIASKPPTTGSLRSEYRNPARSVGLNTMGSIRSRLKGKSVLIGRSVAPGTLFPNRRQYAWIGVRDETSVNLLKSAGYLHAEYFPDLTFLNPPLPLSSAKRVDCLLTFRERIPEIERAAEYSLQLNDAIEKTVDWLKRQRKYDLATYYQVDEDRDPMHSLAERHQMRFIGEKTDLDNFKHVFSTSSLVISNRLHALLIGAYCGAIPVALTTPEHVKVVSLFQTIGWDSLIINAQEPQEIDNRLDDICANTESLAQMITRTFARQRELGFEFLKRKLI